jgi:transposase InsO family protein
MNFIDLEKAHHPVAQLCRHLEVPPSSFYAWKKRGPSARSLDDQRTLVRMRAIHRAKKGRYGSPRMHAQLVADGEKLGRGRVARLMRIGGIQAKRKRPFRVMTTDSKHGFAVAPNIVARDFSSAKANEVWVGDITQVDTGEGPVFLAVLLDLFSRRVVGHACSSSLASIVAERALRRACNHRSPKPGLVHHTDRGTQYACGTYRALLAERGFRQSMSRSGNCLDNAVAESFFSTLKAELVVGADFKTRSAAARAIRHYIEQFYNRDRLHSKLGYLPPMRFEELAVAA